MSLASDEANLTALVRERIDLWRSSGTPDTAALLDEFPALRRAKSLVLDLLLEEYCLRTEAGDHIVKSTFCERFPAYSRSIAKMLEVHEYLDRCPQFLADIERVQWPQFGEPFMGFDILEPLGHGSLARVYLAREPALGGRHVVLKVSRFGAREADTLGKLSHPCIVPVHSVQHDDVTGWTAICMPLLGTATAADLLEAITETGRVPVDASIIGRVARDARPISLGTKPVVPEHGWPYGEYSDAVARIGWQLAEALQAAHAQGVVHRDIKPSNVLLAWSGRPMLLDFNLAANDGVTSERIGGTLPYMAPELIVSLMNGRGTGTVPFDPRGDIYSLGAVLFELLTGQLPFKPDNAERLPLDAYQPWLDSKQSPPKPPCEHNPAIDPRLEAIVLKCLAVNPEERYGTSTELAGELRAYLGYAPTAARFVKRNRRAVMAVSTAALAVLFWLAYFFATREPYHQRLLETGLTQYDRGQYAKATDTFTHCLALKPGWPEAHFARGQALRQQRKWLEARADFKALQDSNAGWAHALAGFCAMSSRDFPGASNDFGNARYSGLKDAGFLLNYAYVARKRDDPGSSIRYCSEVLESDPQNLLAIRCRAESYKGRWMQLKQVPPEQAFEDARLDVHMSPESFESHLRAATIFGYASTKDPQYKEEGARYLTRALKLGLPSHPMKAFEVSLAPLIALVDEELLNAAPHDATYHFVTFRPQEPLTTADWNDFLRHTAPSQPQAISN